MPALRSSLIAAVTWSHCIAGMTACAAAEPLALRLVPVKQGNLEASFGNDVARFKTTAVFKAAEEAGADILNPPHPLAVFSYEDGQLFYLFYNVADYALRPSRCLIQRVKTTVKTYAHADDAAPATTVRHRTEVFKLKAGEMRPDQHFAKYSLGMAHRREIVKELEIGFGIIPGLMEGNDWPFEQNLLFKIVEDAGEGLVYSQVRFESSVRWSIAAVLEKNGVYSLKVPELGIDAPNQAPNPVASTPRVEPASLAIVLQEGQGVAGLRIGTHTLADIEQVLGKPAVAERAGVKACNYLFGDGLTFNVYDQGALNTISTRASFGGKTSRGIRHGDSRSRVKSVYGSPMAERANDRHLAFPGVLFHFDADDNVNKIVILESGK